jgi:hypothetical protein
MAGLALISNLGANVVIVSPFEEARTMKYRLHITEREEDGVEYDFEDPVHIPSVGERISYNYRQLPNPRHTEPTGHYVVRARYTHYQEVYDPRSPNVKPEDLCIVTLIVEKSAIGREREADEIWDNPVPDEDKTSSEVH